MIPLSYSYRSLFVRWKTTLMTASGFTLVVAALIVMLAFIKGMQRVCAISGDPRNVIVLNEGTTDEVLSRLPRSTVSQIESFPGIARDVGGRPIASREIFMIASVFKPEANDYVFFPLRGVTERAYEVHSDVHIIRGRGFRPSQSEIIVGRGIQRMQNLNVGDILPIGRKSWKVTGIFESGGSAFESEVWCDLDELASQFKREGMYSSVVARALDETAAKSLAEQLSTDRQVAVDAMTETQYYAEQGKQTRSMESAAWVIAWFMGLGAIFGVMNTMFAAISQRIKDIAVLRLLGFMSWEILISFLLEAIFLAAIGGAIGSLIGYSVNGLTQNASIGAHEVQFSFVVDLPILFTAGAFSLIMGVIGGMVPAMSAMRVKPLEAFR